MTTQTHPPALSHIILGGLALHGTLSVGAIMTRAEVLRLDAAAAGRAVHDLIAQGLASVSRESATEGAVTATPALDDLPRQTRAGAILTFLAQTKAVPHA